MIFQENILDNIQEREYLDSVLSLQGETTLRVSKTDERYPFIGSGIPIKNPMNPKQDK